MYYKKLQHTMEFQKKPEPEGMKYSGGKAQEDHWVHQCKDCLTVYDHSIGDARSELLADMPFDQLPENFTCSLCEGPKSNYIAVNSKKLSVA